MLNQELSDLRSRRLRRAFDIASLVEDVAIVAMPARSGSSWLIETLKQSEGAVHLKGELTPLLRLNNLAVPTYTNSEALGANDVEYVTENLVGEISLEAGWPEDDISDPDAFIEDTLFRLYLQWPNLKISPSNAEVLLREILANFSLKGFDAAAFTCAVISQLSDLGENIDIGFYDFGKEPAKITSQLPWDHLYESPPFITFRSWRNASAENLKGKVLIVKSAGDIHRLSFYKQLFKNARFRIIHLARNPAATVNGLMDGWKSSKYQSFNVGNLNISDYSDMGENWRSNWWKFDLAPGWESFRSSPLSEVCAWQWKNSQETILDWVEQHKPETFYLRYEDLIGNLAQPAEIVGRLCKWLNLSNTISMSNSVVNASKPPSMYRWKLRSNTILPILEEPEIKILAERLDYRNNFELWP